jgi:aryl-alcohol dehydrogenase-like predicted oxidoreductase
MDYVDLYQIHRWDYDTPIEETLEALHDVVKVGKARYIGASSMHAWQFARALGIAERHGWTRFVSMQNLVNLLYREEERGRCCRCARRKVSASFHGAHRRAAAEPRLGLHQHPHRNR